MFVNTIVHANIRT